MTTNPVMIITDEQIAEIEYLASNATKGDWEFHIGEIRANYDSDGYTVIAEAPSVPKNWRDQRDTNMRYMATVCPVVAQALISRLRAAERDAGRYAWIRDHHNDSCGNIWVSAYQPGGWRSLDSAVHGELADNADLDLDAAIDTAMKGDQQ